MLMLVAQLLAREPLMRQRQLGSALNVLQRNRHQRLLIRVAVTLPRKREQVIGLNLHVPPRDNDLAADVAVLCPALASGRRALHRNPELPTHAWIGRRLVNNHATLS